MLKDTAKDKVYFKSQAPIMLKDTSKRKYILSRRRQ